MNPSLKCIQLATKIKTLNDEAMRYKGAKAIHLLLMGAAHDYMNALTCYQWLTQNDDNGPYNDNAKRYELEGKQKFDKAYKAIYGDYHKIEASDKEIYKILHTSLLGAFKVESANQLDALSRAKFCNALRDQWKACTSKVFDFSDDRMPDIMGPLNKADKLTTAFAFKDPKPADIVKVLDLLQESKEALDAYIEDLEELL